MVVTLASLIDGIRLLLTQLVELSNHKNKFNELLTDLGPASARRAPVQSQNVHRWTRSYARHVYGDHRLNYQPCVLHSGHSQGDQSQAKNMSKLTYTTISRKTFPKNWVSGHPVRLFGIYLWSIFKIAKPGYPWTCAKCFDTTVYEKGKVCDKCK